MAKGKGGVKGRSGRHHRTLGGLGLGEWPPDCKVEQTRTFKFWLTMREAFCRKHNIGNDREIPITFLSSMIYAAKCYMEEQLVQKILASEWEPALTGKHLASLLKQISNASMKRHAAVLKLGLTEKEIGLGMLDFGDDDDPGGDIKMLPAPAPRVVDSPMQRMVEEWDFGGGKDNGFADF